MTPAALIALLLAAEGPVLDLGEEEETAPPAASTTPAEQDPFAGRTEKQATLAERAAAILDRTVLGGYAEYNFDALPGESLRFSNHRYVLFVYSQISERISTATEIEFEFGGSPLKRGGILGVGEALLEFSIVDFEVFEWLVLRAGIILVPFGTLNLRHDSPTQDLSDRPLAFTTVVPSTWFEAGAGLHGTFALGGTHQLDYEVYVINGLDARISDGLGMRGARGSLLEDNNDDKAIVGRVAYSPWLGLEGGTSFYTGAYDPFGERVLMFGLDGLWKLGAFELLGEYVRAFIDEGFVEGFPEGSAANTREAVPTDMQGFYVQGNLHFTIPPLWALLPDDLAGAVLTGVLRYEQVDTDMALRNANDRARLTLGLNFRPLEPVVLKLDLHLNRNQSDGEYVDATNFFADAPEVGFASSIALLF